MNKIDRQLANLQTEVELHGRSGSDSIYLTDVQATFKGNEYELPMGMRDKEVEADLDWFLSCADIGETVPHPDPYSSFWLMQYGAEAKPYGATWNVPYVTECLTIGRGRRAVLQNPLTTNDHPCILSFQFHRRDTNKVDLTVNLRSSDVVGCLAFDVALSRRLLEVIAKQIDCEAGDMTFNLGDAHVLWSDCIHGIDEFTRDSDY